MSYKFSVIFSLQILRTYRIRWSYATLIEMYQLRYAGYPMSKALDGTPQKLLKQIKTLKKIKLKVKKLSIKKLNCHYLNVLFKGSVLISSWNNY